MEAENSFAIAATTQPFTDKPSQPSDSAEYSLYLAPTEDTNRHGASEVGISEPQSLPAPEPLQAERDDGPSSLTVVVTARAENNRNVGESGNQPLSQEPHQMEIIVSGSGDDPQSTTVSNAPEALNPGLTGAKEDEPPFPEQGIGV